ncbi:MAG: hypothetical protein Kow0099_16000 [Candidatus Abyssubacteria bacterium]
MKAAYRVIVTTIVVLVIILVLVSIFVDALVERGIEHTASRSLQVKVELAQADLSVFGGNLALSDFHIFNPEGFTTEHLFKSTRTTATVAPADIFKDEITIESVIIESPSLTIEQSMSGANVRIVLENVQGEKPTREPAEKKLEEEKKYRIHLLRLTGAQVTFASFLPGQQPITVSLPDMQMENVSSEDGTGLVLGRVLEVILVKMIQTALVERKDLIPAEISNVVAGELRTVVPGLPQSALEKAKEALERGTEKLKGLFD